jgi:hypothetical protein
MFGTTAPPLVRVILRVGPAAIGTLFVIVALVRAAELDRYDTLADSPMVENRPTPETMKLLKDEVLFQRATQTYLWALPLIGTLGMKFGSEKVFGAGYNVLPVWRKRLDAKTLVTTPNSDIIYAMSYLDVGKDGPMVFEAPFGLQGILLDCWRMMAASAPTMIFIHADWPKAEILDDRWVPPPILIEGSGSRALQ